MDDVPDAGAQLLVGLDLLLQAQLLGAQHVQLVRDPRQEFLLKGIWTHQVDNFDKSKKFQVYWRQYRQMIAVVILIKSGRQDFRGAMQSNVKKGHGVPHTQEASPAPHAQPTVKADDAHYRVVCEPQLKLIASPPKTSST